MKIDRLDAHDRYQHFTSQNFDIGECCQNLIDQRPFGRHPFYIFAHSRTDDDGLTKRLIWQPRLTKPRAEANSMLFKAYPGTDIVKIIWMIPAQELWGNFKKGAIDENKSVTDSIYNFRHHRGMLEASEDDDLSDEEIAGIYREISIDAHHKKEVAERVKKVQDKIKLEFPERSDS